MTFLDGEPAAAVSPRTPSTSVGVAEVTHRVIRDGLSEYVDGSLGDLERRRVDEHLRRCDGCRGWLNTLRETKGLLESSPRQSASDSLKQRLRQIPEA